MTLPKICRKAFETNGEEIQRTVCIEELSELTKALCKQHRGIDNFSDIAEEAADALLTIYEWIDHLGIKDAVSEYLRYKVDRLAHDLGVKFDGDVSNYIRMR